MNRIKVALVDDQELFRRGVDALLQKMKLIEVCLECSDGFALLEALARGGDRMPDIILMDMEMPGMNGIELNRKVRALYPHIKVITLSLFDQGRYVFRMVEEGVSGYLSKNCSSEELEEAIMKVNRTGFYFSDLIKNALKQSSEFKKKQKETVSTEVESISPREIEVLKLICMEYTNTEIAEKLFLSARTVDGHRNNLLTKTNSKNTAGLVIFAIKHGIYELLVP